MLIAYSGVDVTVIEKRTKVAAEQKLVEKDGFTYDRGPTFFHFPQVIEEIFQAVGLDAHKELELIQVDRSSYRLVFGAGKRLMQPVI